MGSSSFLGLAAAELTLGRPFELEFEAHKRHRFEDVVDEHELEHRPWRRIRSRSTTNQIVQIEEEEEEEAASSERLPDINSDVDDLHNHYYKVRRMQGYLKCLEEERRKIEVFKRELPMCMKLLTAEIEASKEELSNSDSCCRLKVGDGGMESSRSTTALMQLEEFIPMRRRQEEEENKAADDDKTEAPIARPTPPPAATAAFWAAATRMSEHPLPSAALGRQTSTASLSQLRSPEEESNPNFKRTKSSEPRTSAFFPVMKRAASCSDHHDRVAAAATDQQSTLTHSCTLHHSHQKQQMQAVEEEEEEEEEEGPAEAGGGSSRSVSNPGSGAPSHYGRRSGGGGASPAFPSSSLSSSHHCRKQRRCWSSDLHRKFVHALEQLGGAEAATPKLIREIMKEEGLTNDEVKSHLQKYRLHTRKPGSSASESAMEAAAAATGGETAAAPHLVVLGGIWLPPLSNKPRHDHHVRPTVAAAAAGVSSYTYTNNKDRHYLQPERRWTSEGNYSNWLSNSSRSTSTCTTDEAPEMGQRWGAWGGTTAGGGGSVQHSSVLSVNNWSSSCSGRSSNSRQLQEQQHFLNHQRGVV